MLYNYLEHGYSIRIAAYLEHGYSIRIAAYLEHGYSIRIAAYLEHGHSIRIAVYLEHVMVTVLEHGCCIIKRCTDYWISKLGSHEYSSSDMRSTSVYT